MTITKPEKINPYFLEIDSTELDDDLASYGLLEAKKGEVYGLKVVQREMNLIRFKLVQINN